MKIVFYNAKPYDRIWFGFAAIAEGFEVEYVESGFDASSINLARGCDAVCIPDMSGIYRQYSDTLIKYGVRAVLLRSTAVNGRGRKMVEENGLAVLEMTAYSPRAAATLTLDILPALKRK